MRCLDCVEAGLAMPSAWFAESRAAMTSVACLISSLPRARYIYLANQLQTSIPQPSISTRSVWASQSTRSAHICAGMGPEEACVQEAPVISIRSPRLFAKIYAACCRISRFWPLANHQLDTCVALHERGIANKIKGSLSLLFLAVRVGAGGETGCLRNFSFLFLFLFFIFFLIGGNSRRAA